MCRDLYMFRSELDLGVGARMPGGKEAGPEEEHRGAFGLGAMM